MDITTLLVTTAKTLKISPALLVAICTVESTNLSNIHVQDDKGSPSYGACQVKKATAQFMGKVYKREHLKKASDKDMREVKINVKAAALYLKYQLNRYDNDYCKAVAAYNAGSFKESKKNPGQPINMGYVKKVMSNLDNADSLFICGQNDRLTNDNVVSIY